MQKINIKYKNTYLWYAMYHILHKNTYRSKYKKTPVCQHDTGRKIG